MVSGSASVAGLGPGIPAGWIVPMAPGIWLGASRLFEVERVSRETAATEIRVEAIQALAGFLLQALPQIEERKNSEARLHLEQRQQLDGRLGATALGELSGVKQPLSALPESALLSAARIVGESLGLEVRAPMNPSPREHPLAAIAATSGFRTRSVLLAGDWWRRDSGPLVAFRRADKSPVALIPKRRLAGSCCYDLIDSIDGSVTVMDAEAAAALDSLAFSFYKRFGASTAFLDLARFALQPYKCDLAVVVFCGAAASLLSMAVPAASSVLFGQAIPDADRSLLLQVTLGMGAACLGSGLFYLTQSISMVRIQSGMSIALQCGVWDRLLQLSPAFFRKFSVGDLWLRADSVDRIRRQLTLGVLTGLFTGIASLFNVGLMLYYSAPLGAIACLAGTMIVVVTAVASRRLYRLEESRQKVPVIASALTLAWIFPGTSEPAIPIGIYLAFAASFGTFMTGIVNLSETITGLSVATIWSRSKPILAEVPEVQSTRRHPGQLTGSIKFDHVGFRYNEGGAPTLEDASLDVQPGECVALVGPSGSGKSTIVNLLLQFEIPASGAIYLDGQDLSSLDVSAVRRQFGVVNQDSRLIGQSIFENIVCGSLHTLDDAWEAAAAVAVAADIEEMPMGMYTVVSEGGTNLSGGQRQRILIARALVRKPAVLIFDEATSALDNQTQRRVTENLSRLRTTRIIVAHRLSTIWDADRIYVIDSGRVVQHGTYDELVAMPGPFMRLVKNQLAT